MSYPREFPDLVGVEQEFFKGPDVAQDVLGDLSEVAMALVNVIHMPIATLPERQALQHGEEMAQTILSSFFCASDSGPNRPDHPELSTFLAQTFKKDLVHSFTHLKDPVTSRAVPVALPGERRPNLGALRKSRNYPCSRLRLISFYDEIFRTK
jgi:hypothetical protein